MKTDLICLAVLAAGAGAIVVTVAVFILPSDVSGVALVVGTTSTKFTW